MSTIPRIDDIRAGVVMLQQRSVEAYIATVSWNFAARGLADLWGFSEVCGADLEFDRRRPDSPVGSLVTWGPRTRSRSSPSAVVVRGSGWTKSWR